MTLIACLVLLQTRGRTPVRVNTSREAASVRQFVQRFYDWYAPKAYNGSTPDIELEALNSKREMFAPALRTALLDDRRAQEKSPDFIVGIEIDPFLGGDDNPRDFKVGRIDRRGHNWLAHVRSVYTREQGDVTNLTAKIEKTKAGWRFTNFIYEDGDNLMSYLRRLKNLRNSNP